MSESVHTNTSLWSKGMKAVIVAQFLSAFGDNALLFATLALLKAQFYPEWSQPILQMVFVGAYILFAPFVGQVADSFAKGRVMMFANGLKLLGAASICFGINPFLGYTLVGVGAAAYSPAKYGILGELTTGSKLVKANGLMEASTIAAILLGSVAGGVLADWHVLVALAACALAYGGAVVANIYIPKLAAARPGQSWNLINMTRSFLNACTSLWRNGETRFSLVGTSLFWGAGVTLRFLLVLWVPVALGITDNATPHLSQRDGSDWYRGWRRCGSEVSYAGNRVTLYASRDFDWRGGTDFFPATRAAASLCLVDADWRDGGLFCRSAQCVATGAG
ncbi:major facilitator superfamily protein [Escherichia coli]|uniref:Major facilitator superfamily protein n=1 Tax=Escherichia coli TaxID=562 RepID=A0A376KP79_ECOLX|nr:major facilitator superfamily protein [Escherichia coli]